MTKNTVPPKYRHQKSRNLAVVRIHGKDYYLGEYGSAASRQLYAQLIAEKWADTPANIVISAAGPDRWPLVDELIARYMTKHVNHHYLDRDGKPSERYKHIRKALRLLHKVFGAVRVNEFGTKRFKTLREEMIRQGVEEQGGYARSYVNDHMSIIRNFFRWGVEEEQVPVKVHQALAAVEKLRKGRDGRVREKVKIPPVPVEIVNQTLGHLCPQLATMVQLQLFTGMRPDEVTILRLCDIDRSGEIWVYTPQAYKTEHLDLSRKVYFGPKCQELLKDWLGRPEEGYLFSPREVALAARKRHRRSTKPVAEKLDYSRAPRDHYDDKTYCRAVKRVCKRFGIPPWTPNQLRHTAGTYIREVYGLEAAQTILGHQSMTTTEIYAEKDAKIAIKIMKESG
jgi:integrase